MAEKKTKTSDESSKKQSFAGKRTIENILVEYKVMAIKLHKYADVIAESDDAGMSIAAEQARLLDDQQSLLIEAQSMKIQNRKAVQALLELWRADEIYETDVTPSQGLVLNLQQYFEREAA